MERYRYLEGGSVWYSRIATEIEQFKIGISPREKKRYKLDLLLRVARRVDEFSQVCGECQSFREEIEGLVKELSLLLQMPGKPDKTAEKKYTDSVKTLVAHLKKTHKLVDKHYYLSIGGSIGTGIGIALGGLFGELLDVPAIGTPVGIILGFGIGYYLDKKAEREGRLI